MARPNFRHPRWKGPAHFPANQDLEWGRGEETGVVILTIAVLGWSRALGWSLTIPGAVFLIGMCFLVCYGFLKGEGEMNWIVSQHI
jgi:hypothetical protein